MSSTYKYQNQTGPMKVRMTNDYLFRSVMQSKPKVLKAFVGALLHLDDGQITSVEIRNPIVLGAFIDQKEYILDLLVVVNGFLRLNIELQVVDQHNWRDRSLLYLCREFDNINHGDEYDSVMPVIQIGLLDFSLMKEEPEFYSVYRLTDEKTGRVYTDKFQIRVMELRQSGMATDEDKTWKLDEWARFLKAESWEDMKR